MKLIVSCLLVFSACSSMPIGYSQTEDEVCAAQIQPPAATVEDPGVEPPTVIRRAEPIVGRSLRGRNAEATVEAIIGEDGTPRNVCTTAGDAEWGRYVAAALRQWRFRPATLDGKPIAVRFTLTTSFRSEPPS